jgi:hypothetical protein
LATPLLERLRAPLREVSFPAWVAIAMIVVPGWFDIYSIISLPFSFGAHLAKGVDALGIVLIALWAFYSRNCPRFNLPMVLLLVFVGHAVLSVLWAADEASFRYGMRPFIRTTLVGVAIYVALRTRRDLEHFLLAWKIVSGGTAVLVLVEIAFPGFRVDELFSYGRGYLVKELMQTEFGMESFHRARGPMAHPNWLGFYFGASLMLQPYLWLRYPGRNARLALIGVTVLELIALVLGYVRLGVAGAAVGALWIILRGGVKHRALTLLAIPVVIALVTPLLPQAWIARVVDYERWENDKSVEGRMDQFMDNLPVAYEHAAWGTGYGCYGYTFIEEAKGPGAHKYHTIMGWSKGFKVGSIGGHNTYLEIIIEQGLIGLGLYMAMGLVLFNRLLRAHARNRGDPVSARLGIVFEGMLVSVATMNFALHTQDQRTTWLVAATASTFVSLSAYELMRSNPKVAPAPSVGMPGSNLRLAVVAFLLGATLILLAF